LTLPSGMDTINDGRDGIMKSDPLLEVRDLAVSFKNKALIHNLSFCLKKGERISISGKSGSGKTTLLKCLMGFAHPDAGFIFVEGQVLDERSVWPLRQKIGYVPQEPDLGSQRVEDFLQHPFQFKANRNLRWDEARVRDLFELFHLEEELLEKKTPHLSGGEKQRIALISALLMERNLYLFDEITSALDDETRKIVIHYLRERKDLTLLFVTHDTEIKALSHKVFSLKKGFEMRSGS
jgi:putative ABC transport system ATP-binding protein